MKKHKDRRIGLATASRITKDLEVEQSQAKILRLIIFSQEDQWFLIGVSKAHIILIFIFIYNIENLTKQMIKLLDPREKILNNKVR